MPSLTVRFLAVIMALAACGCGVLDRTPPPEATVEALAEGLRDGRVPPEVLVRPGDAQDAQRLLTGLTDALGVAAEVPLAGPVTRPQDAPTAAATPSGDGDTATARLRWRWPLLAGNWTYDSDLPLRLVDGRWKVAWTPAILHPRLGDGHTVELRRIAPERGPILSADAEPLFEQRLVVTVYVQPRDVDDLDRVTRVLDRLLGIDPGPLRARVRAADPDHMVEVVTLRMEDYAPLRTTLRPVPGLKFRKGEQLLTPDRAFARALVGRVGTPTAEILAEAPEGFTATDVLGLSGLQRSFQRELSGTPGATIVLTDADGDDLEVLDELPPEPGEALRTTLDVTVQQAADAALAPLSRPSSLVALRPSTGAVLAVANGPDGGGENLAFVGRYPPGSTFKVVTGAALLDAGRTPRTRVTCPRRATVGGRAFRNADHAAGGRTTLRGAMAASCNTAFVQLAGDLDDTALADAAAAFGFEAFWQPGIHAFTGHVPPPRDAAEQAADAIGQGRVLASPLAMASVVAAIADGTWHTPVVLPDHASTAEEVPRLPAEVLADLRGMLRAVVTDGTGRALADAPGGPVIAKTGTAEHGSADPPSSHAWVVAAQGDLAVAVVVEDGGSGGAVAAPVAARFLRRLAAAGS